MQSGAITTLFLPLALGIIMFGLGLSLTLADFKRIVRYPKAVVIGLGCQMLILPVICFFIAKGFHLAPELAVGLMLLAASPGGATANLYSHLSNGDVALNISLTALNSVLSLFTLPLIVNLSLLLFMEEGQQIPMQFKKVVEVFAIVLVPVSIGMAIHARFPSFSQKMEKPVKIASALLLILVIAAAISKESDNLLHYFGEIGLAALLFNVLSMAVGYNIPKWLGIGERQAIAIGMEIGIHNGTLAIFIALSVLNNSMMSIPAAIYSLIMFFTAALFGFWINRKTQKAA